MSERELNVICERCEHSIADGGGTLWIDQSQVNRHEREVRDWEAAQEAKAGKGSLLMHSAEDIFSYPKAVPWSAHHSVCDPALGASAYSIEVHRLRTWADLVHWTAHLMEKSWLAATDWSELLAGVANGDGTRVRPVQPPTLNF